MASSNNHLVRSLAGFFAALIIGALIPRTFLFLVRRVVLKSFKDVLILALAGILTERLARLTAHTSTQDD